MNKLAAIGAILVVLGIVGLAVPWFTTTDTKDVANIGNLHVQAQEQHQHSIPPMAAGAVLVVGIVVLGGGLFRRT
ncbi:MAG TPA: hypothetical protein VGG27_09750 [Magnetospirillaceae bacterium]|jgi:hypothetical protein